MLNSNLFDLKGRTAMITGGASGLGLAITKGLSACGANVILLDINKDAMKSVITEIRSGSGTGLGIEADVTKSEDVKRALEIAAVEYKRIDILVNCAGITRRMPAEDFREQDWDQVIDINLKGTFICCREIGRHMLNNSEGSIINITSLGAHVAITNSVAYCASKGGVAQLTKTLAVEWAARGVRVNAISPGVFETPLLKQCIAGDAEYGTRMLSKIPMGKFGKPDEIAGPVIFLASKASSHVTAHILKVDGGYLAQ